MLAPSPAGGAAGGVGPGAAVAGVIPPSPKGSPHHLARGVEEGEELLPLSTSSLGISMSSLSGMAGQGTGAGKSLGMQGGEEDERTGLLEEEGGEEEGSGPGTVQQRGSAGKRGSLLKARGDDKLERKRSRSSHNADGWNVRENFWWLWGGSQYSGLLCVLASSLCYSLMGLLVRLLAVHTIPAYETVAVRCAVIAGLSAAGLSRMGHPLLGSPNLRILLAARAAIGFLALSAFFYSIHVLPLRDATVLNFTAPIFTALFARLTLEEKFGSREIAGSACCLLGVLMVNQPPLLFGGHAVLPDLAATSVQRQETVFGVLSALLSAALGAAACCIVRVVGKTGEPPLAVVFVLAAVACPASLLCLLLFQEFVVPSAFELAGMIVVGVVAFGAQVFLTRGLQLEKAGRATSMQYAKAIGTYVLGVLFWGEFPSSKGAAGSLLICASIAFIAFNEKETRTDERA